MNMKAMKPEMPVQIRTIVREMPMSMPHPDQVSYYALEEQRKLYLDEEVGDNVLQLQRMILRWNIEDMGLSREERKPIWLYIYSPGGEVGHMWSLIDTIEASDTPVYTVNMGLAASAASLIFIAGEKRFMMPRARVLIHEGSAQMAGDSVKVLDASDSYRKVIKQMKDYLLDRTGITAATLNKHKNHDWELDADYCLEHGVCHSLIKHMSDVV